MSAKQIKAYECPNPDCDEIYRTELEIDNCPHSAIQFSNLIISPGLTLKLDLGGYYILLKRPSSNSHGLYKFMRMFVPYLLRGEEGLEYSDTRQISFNLDDVLEPDLEELLFKPGSAARIEHKIFELSKLNPKEFTKLSDLIMNAKVAENIKKTLEKCGLLEYPVDKPAVLKLHI